MRTVCTSGIQSTVGLTGFKEGDPPGSSSCVDDVIFSLVCSSEETVSCTHSL